MMLRLDSIVRSTTLAEMPLKVSDPDWMQKLDENESTPAKRSKRSAAKSR